MENRKENKIEIYISYVVVSLSLIIGSFGGFWLYIYNYIKVDNVVRTRIEDLLDGMSVVYDKRIVYMFIMSCIAMLLLWTIGFVMYKIIFKIAKVTVKDVELLIALGTAYTISFLIGCFLVDKIPFLIVILITNITEFTVIFFGLFDKIKKNISKCIIIRGIILILNVAISVAGK